jgi:hypothetical protein
MQMRVHRLRRAATTVALILTAACGARGSTGRPGPSETAPTLDAADPSSRPPLGPDAGNAKPPPGDDSPDGATGGATGGAGGAADTGPAPPPAGEGQQVVVEAGDLARKDTIVSFPLAAPAAAGKSFVLRDGQGATLPLQLHENGQAAFVLPALAAGAQAVFTLQEAPAAPAAAVTAARESDGVKLSIGASTVFRYQTQGKLPGGVGQSYLRGGYIHPLFTPAAVLVTDDYPGDHRHHHGIWSAWAHTHFEGREMDFWNMGGGSAKVDFESLASSWEGPVHAGFRAHHLFTDLRGNKTALREEWVVTVYRVSTGTPAYFVFDLDSTQEAASASPVNLDQYLYGGFAFRGSAQWQSGANFLTSEGKDRGSGDNTTARWCYIGGRVDGKPAGYAVLGHPGNFRAPQPMRINPTDPYFSFSPVKPGGFPIVQGKPYVSRFRFVVADGPPDAALFERQWNDYARPPRVSIRGN